MGQMAITAELLRLTALKPPDEKGDIPFTGALKVLNTATMGKQMSPNQGIELYKEKIRKKPRKPDYYIGLGNIYRVMNQYTFAKEQYGHAIEHGPFFIESYLSLAKMAEDSGDLKTALSWLEKGRPYLKRPVICKDINMTAEEIMDSYLSFHYDLLEQTGSRISPILQTEYMAVGKSLKKIGRNEKCPCGSGKKYKKCCMKGK
jgi:tetratricopeptide (TPR) repeat protein